MITKTITDPLSPEIQQAGEVQPNDLLEAFTKFPWAEFSNKMKAADEKDICYSPSLGFQNTTTNHKIEISFVEFENDKVIFYLFYIRPKEVKKLFGFKTEMKQDYMSDLLDQNEDNCIKLINHFAKDEYASLEEMFKK
ncbi:hypothetical protein P4E94_19205 [Pontiellaceae bacterium B12219]|nr:hypothetical protein [Pontiellaceae bacterium B12219]